MQTGFLQTCLLPKYFFFSNYTYFPLILHFSSLLFCFIRFAQLPPHRVPEEIGGKGIKYLNCLFLLQYSQTRQPYNCHRHWVKIMTGVYLLTSLSGTGGFSAWLQLSALFVYGLAGSYTGHWFLLGGSRELECRGELVPCRIILHGPGALYCIPPELFFIFNGTRPVVLHVLTH